MDSGLKLFVSDLRGRQRQVGSLAGAAHLTLGTGLLERVGTGIVGTKGYVVLPTGVSTDVSRDIV